MNKSLTTETAETEYALSQLANVAHATLRAHVESCDACDVGGCREGYDLQKKSDDLELQLLQIAMEF